MNIRISTSATFRAIAATIAAYPGACASLITWHAVIAALLLGACAVERSAHRAVSGLRESLGMHVIVAPGAAGLAALGHTIGQLPGVRDARFVVRPHIRSVFAPDTETGYTLQYIHVRPRWLHPDSLGAVASRIGTLPHVADVVFAPELAQYGAQVIKGCQQMTALKWYVIILVMVIMGRVPCLALMRATLPHARVMAALGASRLRVAAPPVMIGGCGGAMGAVAAWGVFLLLTLTSGDALHDVRFSPRTGWMLIGAMTLLGSLVPLLETITALRRRDVLG